MEEKRSWWQIIKQHWVAILVVAIVVVVAIILVIAEMREYGTGFAKKTLWDWLQLLIIPLFLAGIALVFQFSNSRTERQIAKQRYEQDQQIALDKLREDLLQAYINGMSELLLEKKLRESAVTDEVRTIARVRTLTVLRRLDGERKGSLLIFLHESSLINKDKCIINLIGGDLHDAKLWLAKLSRAELQETNFPGANLNGVDLVFANLNKADLYKANLYGANLSGANLSETNLGNVDLRNANLKGANLSKASYSGTFSRKFHGPWRTVDLRYSNLIGANLRDADFSGVDLSNSNLKEANLNSANLEEATLSNASLENVNLSGARLGKADLRGADLSGANMDNANLSGAILNSANLSKANVTPEQLAKAKSLKGAIMPDGSIHP